MPPGDVGSSVGTGEELSRTWTVAAPLAVWTTGVWTRESMGMRCGTRVPHWAYLDVVVRFNSLHYLRFLGGAEDVPFT